MVAQSSYVGDFVAWVALMFLYPTDFLQVQKWTAATDGTIFGLTGSVFLIFSGPILIITFLSIAFICVSSTEDFHQKKNRKLPRFRLWTFPVLVDGMFGVVSAAEFIGIVLFTAYVLFALYVYTTQDLSYMSKFKLPSREKSGLNLIFKKAISFAVQMLQWTDIGIANLPGVISLLAGLVMWATSFPPIRKKYFELFFFTHQLYIVFLIFFAFHVGDFLFSMTAGAIFIFMLDRFLRFCQSQKTVKVISATCLPCGTVELVLSKPENLHYNALSFIFLKVRELSWLQWHPFSVSSSPLDGKHHLSVLIKVLGGWTKKLRDNISMEPEELENVLPFEPISKITASVEGPYGHELAYHLMYENLILVAGGIGISPFLAILRDILHRINMSKSCLPKNAYVTRESEPPLEQGKFHKSINNSYFPLNSKSSMSGLVGTGDNMWSGVYVILSTIGFIIFLGLMDLFYITPFGISTWWFKALLFIVCMALGVLIFGGLVVLSWHLSERRISSDEKPSENNEESETVQYSDNPYQASLATSTTTRYGCRPDFREIFDSVCESWGHVDVGVIVCGPQSIESSVAKECRSKNIRGGKSEPCFHFNSHSFDL
ncbi:hypothetical protein GIB67_035875 [Kingdonia uniflora]|uniref:FAD-binding FR-type domain-containing protein n=1 Tax=Kingdonia uniflora TaxID=39325 RepID=A0A7J7P7Z9_9MAGN|nr:hypothetical protein GIB67_035875 [Kingdonia uniflora]